ncbi:hypothetical protein ACU5EH_16070 [Aliivibrio salmonicida]|uniref:hypothetical protein n=1 Tax=Aliivibrio salmonicida TaxID=40269 RepID=UPI00406CB675
MGKFLALFFVLIPALFSVHASEVDAYVEQHESQLFYPSQVLPLYPNSQRKWSSPQSRQNLENQLALLVLADLNNSLEHRYFRLQNTTGLEYDILATDTLIYLLTYQSFIQKKGKSWFFGGRLDDHLGEPSSLLISSISESFNSGRLDYLSQTLQPNSNKYEAILSTFTDVS